MNFYEPDSDLDDSSSLVKQKQLEGLINIEFRKKSHNRKALNIFNDLDEHYRSNPNGMEQAVTLFILGNKRAAKSVLLSQKQTNQVFYKIISKLENIIYSKYFLEEVNKLINYIGPTF